MLAWIAAVAAGCGHAYARVGAVGGGEGAVAGPTIQLKGPVLRPWTWKLFELRVSPCGTPWGSTGVGEGSEDFWRLYPRSLAEAKRVERIVYGVVPAGYAEAAPARPLPLGECVEIAVPGDKWRFRLDERGRVVRVSAGQSGTSYDGSGSAES